MPHKDPEARRAYIRARYRQKAEETRKYQAEWRRERLTEGGCLYCLNQAIPGTQRCESHARAANDRLRIKTKEAGFAGVCMRCRHRPARPKKRLCTHCADEFAKVEVRLRKCCREYGITVEQYYLLLAAQNGVCAICGDPPSASRERLDIDHDHRTGQVRGLLCHECNKGIGCLRDDPVRMVSAAGYVQNPPAQSVITCKPAEAAVPSCETHHDQPARAS